MDFSCDFSWGVWTGYFGKDYMPQYDFSGRVYVEKGEIKSIRQIEFQFDDWGPFIRNRTYLPGGNASFTSHIHNWFEGVRVSGTGTEDTILCLETKMGTLRFTIDELKKKKHISKPVGERYSLAILHAEGDDPWYLEQFPERERIYHFEDFSGGAERNWFGVRGKAIGPGEQIRLTIDAGHPSSKTNDGKTAQRYKFRVRFLISGDKEKENQTRGVPRLLMLLNGKSLWVNRRFTTFHDIAGQFLEEVFFTLEVPALNQDPFSKDGNELLLINQDTELTVLIPLLGIQREEMPPLEVTGCPAWALIGETFALTLKINEEAALVNIEYDSELLELSLPGGVISSHPLKQNIAGLNRLGVNEAAVRNLGRGEHSFYFTPKKWTPDMVITFTDKWTGGQAKAALAQLYDVPGEERHCLTGAEVRTGNPDEYLDLVRRFRDERIADLAVFRDYHNDAGNPAKLWEAAAFCRENNIAVDSIIIDDQAVVAKGGAEKCLCVGTHEHTGIFYGRDPVLDAGYTMKEAAEKAVEKLHLVAEAFRVEGIPVAVGDASGGSRYAYMAGFDIIRHETFVGHHMLLLPNGRGAARAFHKPVWGVHMATQHNTQPELEYGIRRLFLGTYLSWIMGAGFLFEEDSQFQYFKAEKMTGGDFLPAGKNAVMQGFYRYNKTHPRRGEPLVNIAIIQGRYAAPISGLGNVNNGSGNNAYTNENYPVWSHTGNKRWSWGYRQCEKGLHLLEILSPGICLTPLHQDAEKVRRFFSGSPRGEYDQLPIEAELSVFNRYKLLLLLDWHTMAPDTGDYEKIRDYAESGGTVFLSIPQLSTRTDREFLETMKDLKLYKNGAVEELCGVTIKGPSKNQFTSNSKIVSGSRWEDFTVPAYQGIRLPNKDENEDGPCFLADVEFHGAIPVISTAEGKPVLVRYSIGKGFVYLLCTYAYPGHEALKNLMPAILNQLLDIHSKPFIKLGGNTEYVNDIYYSVWGEDGNPDKLYLLNTDWTAEKNQKKVELQTQLVKTDITITEGEVTEVSLFEKGLLYAEDKRQDISITLLSRDAGKSIYEIFGLEKFRVRIISNKGTKIHEAPAGKSILKVEY